ELTGKRGRTSKPLFPSAQVAAGLKRPLLMAALGLGYIVIGGCGNHEQVGSEYLRPDSEVRDIDRIAAAQAAAGAREDAMLNRNHFEGAELNSLGRSKLHLMNHGRPEDQRLVVYLDLPSTDERTAARRASVQKYLEDDGLAVGQFELKNGPNPDVGA